MTAARPIVLPHSGLRVHIPDCVRLRADGSDEISGIAPDLPFAPDVGEDMATRGQRLMSLLADDLRRARSEALTR
jgi:hypothetical protein